MDFFRNPWNKVTNDNPFLSLANGRETYNKNCIPDRFCFQSSSSNIFMSNQNKEEVQELEGEEKNSYLNIDAKKKKYEGLLSKTCMIQKSWKNCHKKSSLSDNKFYSKYQRSGYIFYHQLQQENIVKQEQQHRKIVNKPYRILNAPRLKDDFYASLLDWSHQDIVSVVLDNAAYIWSSKENQTQKIIEGYISSIKWGKDLILGEENGRIKIISVEKKKQIARNREHDGRVGSIDCLKYTQNLIASGSKDNMVMIWDARQKDNAARLLSHRQEVCGVRWSFDGNMIASGGNDNAVAIWDVRTQKLFTKFIEHKAAVKALAWSPFQNSTLATGGGSTDRCIRIWNVNEKKCVKNIETGSQVCNLMYSVNSNQLVSTHGFSFNSINVWNTKNMEKVGTLTGHNYRVLYLTRSPDGESILTGSGDQTLRFWKIFPSSSQFTSYESSLETKTSQLR